MRYLIFGPNGQLGNDIRKVLASQSIGYNCVTRSQVDVTDYDAVENTIQSSDADVVMNLTAYHNVELCEEFPELANQVNGLAVKNMAKACKTFKKRLIHVSSDYVFSGAKNKPYVETDCTGPLNSYGISKMLGEMYIKLELEDYLVIRTSSLFGIAGASGKGGNFVETMIRLGTERGSVTVVNDQVMSPTHTLDLARKIIEVDTSTAGIQTGEIVHISNSGSCTWFDFAKQIFHELDLDVEMTPTLSGVFAPGITRPNYSVLSNTFLADNQFTPMKTWQESLCDYLEIRK